MRRERIACPAIGIEIGNETFYKPVSTTSLPMDEINRLLRNRPDLKTLTVTFFVTTFGRVLDADEAFFIALDANQVLNDDTAGPLSPLHIWQRK